MTNRTVGALVALAFATGLATAPASAAIDNAFTSFNGTQGAGNFFYGKVSGGVFTFSTACGPIDFPLTSCLGSASYPYFGVAASAGPHSGAILPVDRLLTHTSTGSVGLMAWRAPVAGNYRIDAVVSLHHQTWQLGNGVGVTSYYQQLGQAAEVLPRFVLDQPEQALSLVRSFGMGDIYGFVLDANGSNAYDLSGINVIATSLGNPGAIPEPATWAMLVAGFGAVGAAARRRRAAAVSA